MCVCARARVCVCVRGRLPILAFARAHTHTCLYVCMSKKMKRQVLAMYVLAVEGQRQIQSILGCIEVYVCVCVCVCLCVCVCVCDTRNDAGAISCVCLIIFSVATPRPCPAALLRPQPRRRCGGCFQCLPNRAIPRKRPPVRKLLEVITNVFQQTLKTSLFQTFCTPLMAGVRSALLFRSPLTHSMLLSKLSEIASS